MIRTVGEAEAALVSFAQHGNDLTGKGITTDRTLRLSVHVGSPHERLKVVHIAGTSGKTSTSYFIRELLEAADQKTGLTVSPHITSVADRVQVGGAPLPDETFVAYFNEFLALIQTAPEQPTYFELLIVFALWVFDREDVAYAVLETGLGGLHDSTNICRRRDKVCVLTDIGFDHMHVLGRTIAEIAAQKSGIIAPSNHILLHKQTDNIMAVVHRTATTMKASIELVQMDETAVKQHWLAEYQQRNWSLAYGVYTYISNRDRLVNLEHEALVQTMHASIPGRMEVFSVGNTTIALDGAHNEQKMRTFWQSFEHKFPGSKPTVVLGMKQGKELEAVAPIVEAHASSVIATMATNMQDIPIGAIDADIIASAFGIDATVAKDPSVALQRAIQNNTFVVVTGSLYLVAEIRALLKPNML